MSRYSRQDVLRILHLQPRQLVAWERGGLIPPSETYSFEELGQLRTLRDLQATRISARSIRTSVAAMRRVSGMRNPLSETSAVRHGARLAFRHDGALVDPVTRQLAFDFEFSGSPQLRVVGGGKNGPANQLNDVLQEVQEMFLRAVQLEEVASTLPQAVEVYQAILALRPEHASASINLGTIYYNRGEFALAEQLYRNATLADPEYALAFFDLGNVLDEMKRLDEAIEAYQRAVALVPNYADAHYNLALAYERKGEQFPGPYEEEQPCGKRDRRPSRRGEASSDRKGEQHPDRRRALRHWLTYVRLDPAGPWASHARTQAKKILSTERLSIVSRRGQRVPIAG